MSNYTENHYRTSALLAIAKPFFIILILVISLFRSCIGTGTDPMDDSINARREVVRNVNVLDSTRNGFRIVYVTKNDVTPERLKEIRSRKHIQETFRKIQIEAPMCFGNMLETDIYDFARFALKYNPDDQIEMHNIFIHGMEKWNLYIGPNPKIPNYAKIFQERTMQGSQYINHDDIYFGSKDTLLIYRYWKCYGINSLSYTDERFSHFSEEEIIW